MIRRPRFAPSNLHDASGRRTYLTESERDRFLHLASKLTPVDRTLCLTLVHTGARPSEVIAIRGAHVDQERKAIVLESLKKRRSGVFRVVPVPTALIDELTQVHAVDKNLSQRLWPVSRWTVYRRVTEVMAAADIRGPQATVRGLRHAFGIRAASRGIPLNLIARWMGHEDLETTAVYVNAIGDEERAMAARMWEPPNLM